MWRRGSVPEAEGVVAIEYELVIERELAIGGGTRLSVAIRRSPAGAEPGRYISHRAVADG